MGPSPWRSMLKFANASSPNTDRAYMFADKKPHSPDNAASGVKHDMFVDFIICFKYCCKSLVREECN